MTYLIGKLVGGKSARRPDQFGRTAQKIRGNEADVGVKMGRPIETVFRCISRGPIWSIHE